MSPHWSAAQARNALALTGSVDGLRDLKRSTQPQPSPLQRQLGPRCKCHRLGDDFVGLVTLRFAPLKRVAPQNMRGAPQNPDGAPPGIRVTSTRNDLTGVR